ncbi:hypothetical protein [Motiliproteus sp. MSK22-1]|uniref:hypothetical protein n=1 Tax=Motiliproteus sp. MSK22-1 TaxID=1897630 RepID=UPI0009787A22|nr:hypothetical protein [Motiliproteus sp. MSK22-1]OMH32068.1 hypothetical protein BGP75_15270 [Motiliproteus sp. MSK22-1]
MDAVETNSAELKQAMRTYGEKSAALETQTAIFSKSFYQGIAALAFALIISLTGMLSLLVLGLSAFATWRIVKCFSIDQQCEWLESEAEQAQDELNSALKKPKARAQVPFIFRELDGESFQGHLATYLPGPVEVRRRPIKWRLQGS